MICSRLVTLGKNLSDLFIYFSVFCSFILFNVCLIFYIPVFIDFIFNYYYHYYFYLLIDLFAICLCIFFLGGGGCIKVFL